jgi:hypothetical protein
LERSVQLIGCPYPRAGRGIHFREAIGKNMTLKEKAVSVIRSLGDDATIDEMIDRLYLLRKVELGIAQADEGDVQEHEQFMTELERENSDENPVDATGTQ